MLLVPTFKLKKCKNHVIVNVSLMQMWKYDDWAFISAGLVAMFPFVFCLVDLHVQ